ncbi:hypothetical protein CXF85_12805 [Colwellia sp. 75C3]|uniref:HvfC/BufC N-terminal domain-containing protein n=1 Tax=Colwellia sp. 75C3 TaxID=888425 RepID=UPI000C324206|nr:DNA-binding domain-containing protein [Colwellia sp. 75C3]PKG82365.1 hypothetical protein CXF85_12805 [Colwellia sp. 75C3]
MNNNDSKDNSLQSDFEQVAQQQQALIATIFPPADDAVIGDFDPRGIAIYRNNLLATAQQALAINFPTVLTLIGKDLFNYACRELLITSPPKHGDWALWGESYPTILSGVAQLSDYSFVADIAQIDWFRQQSMRAKDTVIEQTSLQLLATHDIDELYIELSPSQSCMDSRYPVIEFWSSNQPADESDATENNRQQYLNTAVEKLAQSDFSQQVLIYRPHFNAEIRELSISEYHWLTLINQGVSIGKALDIMSKNNKLENDFDFAQWIGQALEQNLISRLKV